MFGSISRHLARQVLPAVLALLITTSAAADSAIAHDHAPNGAAEDAPSPAPEEPRDSGGAGGAPGAEAALGGGGSGGGSSGRSRPPKKRRGGINPCMTPDPGWGKYDPWVNVSIGQMAAPRKGGLTKSGGFDLLIHFHGHEPFRKEFVKAANGVVLVGIDLGIGSGAYQNVFSAPSAFTTLISSVESAMSKKRGKKAHVRKIALSSWSAGYGAVEQILRHPGRHKIDALVLLDSVHAGYADEHAKTLKVAQIEPFIDFARRATDRKGFMFLSHSSIVPPGYASTSETADFIVRQVRGRTKRAEREDVLGLDMNLRFDRGDFHVRGYTGEDKPDHCAHIGLISGVLKRHLLPRWKTPKAK